MTDRCGLGGRARDPAQFYVSDIAAADSAGAHGDEGIPWAGLLGISLVDTNVIGAMYTNLLHGPMSDVCLSSSN